MSTTDAPTATAPTDFTDFVRGPTVAPDEQRAGRTYYQRTLFVSPCGLFRWNAVTCGSRQCGHPTLLQSWVDFEETTGDGIWRKVQGVRQHYTDHGYLPRPRPGVPRRSVAEWALLDHAKWADRIGAWLASGKGDSPFASGA